MAQIITFSVSEDGKISPSTVQKAGVQGNHNITEIRFEGNSVLNDAISNPKINKVRIQFIDGAGGFYSTGFLTVGSDKIVKCLVPSTVTNAGGIAKVYLVVTKIVYGVEDGLAYEDQVFISSAARISFEGSGVGSPSEYQYRKGISSALVNAEIFVDQAERASVAAKDYRDAAKEYRDNAETFCNEAGNYQSKAGMYASNAETSKENAAESATSAKESKESANHDAVSANIAASVAQSRAEEAANSLQELKDGIASGKFKGDKGDKGDKGEPGETPDLSGYATKEDLAEAIGQALEGDY